jgi:hypothetical protein
MPRLTDAEIAETTGRPAPPKDAPANRVEDAVDKLGELDGRMSALAEKHREPGETHEQAHARLMAENPRLYAESKRARAEIITRQNIGNASTGGV